VHRRVADRPTSGLTCLPVTSPPTAAEVSPLPREFEMDPGPVKARIAAGVVLLGVLAASLAAVVVAARSCAAGATALLSMVGVGAGVLLVVLMGYMAAITFFAVSRTRFHVGARRFGVRTLFREKHWPMDGLRARKHAPHFELRLFGTSMPGYLSGWFLVDGKKTLVYATRRDEGVLLEGDTRVFVTPADPDGMLDALRLAGAEIG
jgi:PH (Pleckstrin Homology) domain-containing protein